MTLYEKIKEAFIKLESEVIELEKIQKELQEMYRQRIEMLTKLEEIVETGVIKEKSINLLMLGELKSIRQTSLSTLLLITNLQKSQFQLGTLIECLIGLIEMIVFKLPELESAKDEVKKLKDEVRQKTELDKIIIEHIQRLKEGTEKVEETFKHYV